MKSNTIVYGKIVLLILIWLSPIYSFKIKKLSSIKRNLTLRECAPVEKGDLIGFHHVEFACGDATIASKMFTNAMGMEIVAKSDLSTGNHKYTSFVMNSGHVQFVLTAPKKMLKDKDNRHKHKKLLPFPNYSVASALKFLANHGFGVRAIGLSVVNLEECFNTMVSGGGVSILDPCIVNDTNYNKGFCMMAEVSLYGDVVVRLIDARNYTGGFLPNYEDVVAPGTKLGKYGIDRIDHIVGNVHKLQETLTYLKNMTGFHEFAEFTAEDVGTVDSGLNSCVLANNNEMILLPVNEPTFGTRRKSQIQTYLEQNQGEGVQHIALFTDDIFATLREMHAATNNGGFEFMPNQDHGYYERVKGRIGEGAFSEEQYAMAEKMGVLIDKDDQGILLQIFTKPIGDRPTIFFEIIQRVGCMTGAVQKPGCGGFGKGNFKDLFKSIEDYENDLKIN